MSNHLQKLFPTFVLHVGLKHVASFFLDFSFVVGGVVGVKELLIIASASADASADKAADRSAEILDTFIFNCFF